MCDGAARTGDRGTSGFRASFFWLGGKACGWPADRWMAVTRNQKPFLVIMTCEALSPLKSLIFENSDEHRRDRQGSTNRKTPPVRRGVSEPATASSARSSIVRGSSGPRSDGK